MPVTEKIAIGSDHRGFEIKEALKDVLWNLKKKVEDKGPFTVDPVDYPEYAEKVAISVSTGECARGILICGSGLGMSLTANKFPGVRAALCHDLHTVEMSRRHNNANILVLAEAVGVEAAKDMVEIWFKTPFEGGRHQKRVELIELIDNVIEYIQTKGTT